jgi:hypothetical protein
MGICNSYAAQFRGGDHRPEFVEEKHGVTTYRCLDCGETIQQFQDTQGG